MPATINTPCAVARQVSGKDPDQRQLLSVLFKRTYDIVPGGTCSPAAEQLPLAAETEFDDEAPAILLADTDLFAHKPRTDIVIKGHAYGYAGRRAFHAVIAVERYSFYLLVSGDRRCTLDARGRPVFSSAEPVEKVPLSFTMAYGGLDAAAHEKYGNPVSQVFKNMSPEELAATSPFRYPRNPRGRGYLVELTREAVDRLQLPNLEDAYDPVTPDRLAAGAASAWIGMPMAVAPGWVSYGWFPRSAYVGMTPPFSPPDAAITEVVRGLVPPGLQNMLPTMPVAAFNLTCGACAALQLPHLRGGERIALDSLHPTRQKLAFQLPVERPRIWTDGRRGTYRETEPVIQTIVIEPDLDRLAVVWRGSAPALREYMPSELENMPLCVVY